MSMLQIEKLIQDWCNECHTNCMTKINSHTHTVIITTTRPGVMIGYKGNLINKYEEKIKEYGYKIKIEEANEIHYPGDDWEKILDDRFAAYFELEEQEFDSLYHVDEETGEIIFE